MKFIGISSEGCFSLNANYSIGGMLETTYSVNYPSIDFLNACFKFRLISFALEC